MPFSILVVNGLIVLAMNWPVTIFGMCIRLACIYGPRKMTKADPNMSKVYA